MSVQIPGSQQRTPASDGNGHTTAAPPIDGARNGSPAHDTAPAPAAPVQPAAPAQPAAPSASPVAAEAPTAAAPSGRRRPRFLTRRFLLPVGGVVLLVVALVAFNAWRESITYVSTDNAQLAGQPVQVGSMNAGRVESIMPTIGTAVHKGDVVAQVALPSQVGTAQNGQPKMGFLGQGDTRVDVQSPIDGVVIAEPVAIGATVAAGQNIISIVDPCQLFVNANIEETAVNRVKVGQPVQVHVDALNQDVPGKVEAVTPATANTFSMLPSSNASGNFTKVTQLVPVRIAVNVCNQPLLLGANVEVKIRVAD